MILLNLDLDILLKDENKKSKYDTEIVIDLGSKIKSNIDNKVILDKSIIDELLKGALPSGYCLSGVHTPIITKEGVDYKGSNLLFTALYLTIGDNTKIYEEIEIRGTKEDLSKIKIVAGGLMESLDGKEVLNLVLKVPKGVYYGVVNEDCIYDENGNEHYKKNKLEVISLTEIVQKCNVVPPRGVYNKMLYRHFKGKWYLVEGVGEYVDTDITLVSYRALYGDYKLYFRNKTMFTSENEKKDEYPIQDFRFMTIKELECSLGEDSNEYREILTEYNKLINEHPYIIGF